MTAHQALHRSAPAALLLLLPLVGTAACGQEPDGVPAPAGEAAAPDAAVTGPAAPPAVNGAGLAGLACGAPAPPASGGPLVLDGVFPESVGPGERALAGSVRISSSAAAVDAVVGSSAEVVLVRGGRIVTEPLPQDSVGERVRLVPGRVEELSASVVLVPCDPAAGRTLVPGAYEIHARVLVDDLAGGQAVLVGGPWPVELS
ncbi:hypothetical protein [Motilibacter aurantiacus]|uniref:hypothetical protein n=1 Tax=Motilibacter aurantiacus TaxID=2714955 RepID=UPI00140C5EB2|nr:hypothetical protein [Motilibacter aurantiacus]NHC46998.1 hypothetical protein [Motilibacter aurantiacus]